MIFFSRARPRAPYSFCFHFFSFFFFFCILGAMVSIDITSEMDEYCMKCTFVWRLHGLGGGARHLFWGRCQSDDNGRLRQGNWINFRRSVSFSLVTCHSWNDSHIFFFVALSLSLALQVSVSICLIKSFHRSFADTNMMCINSKFSLFVCFGIAACRGVGRWCWQYVFCCHCWDKR